jgi:hypothetical protein
MSEGVELRNFSYCSFVFNSMNTDTDRENHYDLPSELLHFTLFTFIMKFMAASKRGQGCYAIHEC